MSPSTGASEIPFTLGLHEIASGVYAYLQPDGGWGYSNAGLIVGKNESFLVDTLFDLKHTRVMLDSMSKITSTKPIVAALNSHENGIVVAEFLIKATMSGGINSWTLRRRFTQ